MELLYVVVVLDSTEDDRYQRPNNVVVKLHHTSSDRMHLCSMEARFYEISCMDG
jgi:hypothetical protein